MDIFDLLCLNPYQNYMREEIDTHCCQTFQHLHPDKLDNIPADWHPKYTQQGLSALIHACKKKGHDTVWNEIVRKGVTVNMEFWRWRVLLLETNPILCEKISTNTNTTTKYSATNFQREWVTYTLATSNLTGCGSDQFDLFWWQWKGDASVWQSYHPTCTAVGSW